MISGLDRYIRIFEDETTSWPCWAKREDQGAGRQSIIEEAYLFEADTRWTVVAAQFPKRLEEGWDLIDDHGVQWQIKRVTDVPREIGGGGVDYLWLFCDR